MEKLIFALWTPPAADQPRWHRQLLSEAPPALRPLGVERLKICVADIPAPENDPYVDMKRGAPAAYISFWLNSAAFWEHADAVLADYAPTRAAYAVAESTILPLTEKLDDNQPAPGVLQMAAFATQPQHTRAETLDIWLNAHSAVAVETQSTTTYTQNIVTRALSPNAPAWDAIVEETFPHAALADRHVYFATGGDAAILAQHETRMAESCARFIDFATLRLCMASEYRFGGWTDAAFGWHQHTTR
jgi:hypothetical protein